MNQVMFHEYIAAQLKMCGKTQREVAKEMGYNNYNIITMFKQNVTKVPIDKIGLLARALGVDPAHMMRLAMSEYMPDAWNEIQKIMGKVVTNNEMEIIEEMRAQLEDPSADPKIRTAEQRQKLSDFAKSL